MSIQDSTSEPVCPPRYGPQRVEHWQRWRADICHDWLWIVQSLREAGCDDEWVADQRDHYIVWLLGMILEALAEADSLAEWSS